MRVGCSGSSDTHLSGQSIALQTSQQQQQWCHAGHAARSSKELRKNGGFMVVDAPSESKLDIMWFRFSIWSVFLYNDVYSIRLSFHYRVKSAQKAAATNINCHWMPPCQSLWHLPHSTRAKLGTVRARKSLAASPRAPTNSELWSSAKTLWHALTPVGSFPKNWGMTLLLGTCAESGDKCPCPRHCSGGEKSRYSALKIISKRQKGGWRVGNAISSPRKAPTASAKSRALGLWHHSILRNQQWGIWRPDSWGNLWPYFSDYATMMRSCWKHLWFCSKHICSRALWRLHGLAHQLFSWGGIVSTKWTRWTRKSCSRMEVCKGWNIERLTSAIWCFFSYSDVSPAGCKLFEDEVFCWFDMSGVVSRGCSARLDHHSRNQILGNKKMFCS